MNVAKNALFFLSRTRAHHSFPFNLRILNELSTLTFIPRPLIFKLHHEVLKFHELERSNFSERQFFSIVMFM